MRAKVIPWSSIVGTGIVLMDDKGKVIGQLALHNVAMLPSDATKDKHLMVAHAVANAINAPKNGPVGVNMED